MRRIAPLFLSLLLLGAAPAAPALPETPKRPTSEVIQGVTVGDDYRWLEDANAPEVKAWTAAQSAYARAALDQLPAAKEIRARVAALLGATSPDWSAVQRRGDVLFALKDQPPRQQPFLVSIRGVDASGPDRYVVDPNALDASGGTAIDWYVPSLDGSRVAVSLSQGGSESGDVHVYDVATGKALPGEVVPRVHGGTAGGSLAWNAEGTGFWYTRYPRDGERPAADQAFFQQVWFHKLGTDGKDDTYVLGKQFPRIAEVALQTSEDGRRVLVDVADGDGGEHAIWLGDGRTFQKVAPFAAQVAGARFGPDGSLFVLSHHQAPRGRVLRLAPGEVDLDQATVVVPEGTGAIEEFLPTATRVWVVASDGGPSTVRVHDLRGGVTAVATPPVSSSGGLTWVGGDRVLLRNASYVTPPAWLLVDAGGPPTKTRLAYASPVSFDDVEVSREVARSRDGTEVPVTVLARKGTRKDGGNPAILTGYGGYGVSLGPSFRPVVKAWLEQGGVYAVANLRGGGEFGEDWHHAGNLTRKQNVFDDFAAVARHLVEAGWTRPARLGIRGGSNGGLLMGAAMTQGPGLYKAVVAQVGIYDMLHVEGDPNGAFNVTEFGSVKDPEQFRALYAYSPYHHVVDGEKYPEALVMTGENDPRVLPYHSRKMVARLQAAGARALLRTSTTSGHGVGNALAQDVADSSDVLAFFASRLGVTWAAVK